jgi:hypothetical protein
MSPAIASSQPPREAVDCHDDGLAQTLDLPREGLSAPGLICTRACGRERVQLGDVGSRRESPFAGAGNNDRSDGIVTLHRGQRLGDFLQEPSAKRVEHARPVERNDANRLVDSG